MIVGGMSRRDLVLPVLIEEREEETISLLARRGFQVSAFRFCFARRLAFAAEEFQAPFFGSLRDEALVFVRFSPAQMMVEVGDGEGQSFFVGKLAHEIEQKQ